MWGALLRLFRDFGEAWSHLNSSKAFAALFAQLREGFGKVTLRAVPCVLPLIASVPPQMSSGYKSGASKVND